MPVAQDGPAPARQAVLVGLGALLGVLAILFLILQADRLFGSTDLDISLGDGIFKPGPVDELAEGIENEGPLLLSDPAGGDRDLWVNHTGDEAEAGWSAFAARPPTASRDCFVNWAPAADTDDDANEAASVEAGAGTFVDTCDGTVYPADGAGLPQYPVAVDADGILSIDLSVSPTVSGDTDS